MKVRDKEINITRDIYHKLTDNNNGLLYSRVARAFFLFSLIFLFPVIYAKTQYKPGAAFAANIARADIGHLMSIGHSFLIVAFVVTIVMQVFRAVIGTESLMSIFNTIFKYSLLFALYSYGGDMVSTISESLIANTNASNDQISATYVAFDQSLAKLTMGPQDAPEDPKKAAAKQQYQQNMDNLPDGAAGIAARRNTGALDDDAGIISTLSRIFSPAFIWGFIFALILKFLLILSLATKYLLLDITWPIVHQLVLLGFVFAVPFVAFSGWDPVKKFAVTVVEVSCWPIIYNIGFGVAAKMVQGTFDHYTALLAGAGDYETMVGVMYASIDDLAKLFGYFIFLITLGTLTPAIAAMVVRSESGAAIAGAMASTVSGVVSGGMGAISGRGKGGGMTVNNTTKIGQQNITNNTTGGSGDSGD